MKKLMIYKKSEKFPIGNITVSAEKGKITGIEITEEQYCSGDETAEKCLAELREYFNGERKSFSFSVEFKEGTIFQKKVWSCLLKIPYGETLSYGEVAAMAGCPGGARAVGNAVHNNPVMIVVPCHRVICSSGKAGGFASGTENKVFLLSLEKKNKNRFS